MSHRPGSWTKSLRLAVVLLGTMLLVLACGLTPEDLQSWPQRKEGGRLLAAVVVDGQRPMKLRRAAALILTRMGATLELADALSKSKPQDRVRIVAAIGETLSNMLDGSFDEQIRAKEIVYYAGGHASDVLQQQLGKDLIEWASADFSVRSHLGDSSLKQVLPAMGSQVAVPLLRLLQRGGPYEELTATLHALESVEVDRAAALILLSRGSKALPEIPISLAKSVMMLKRPELTPLLVDAVSDTRVDKDVRRAFLDHMLDCKGPETTPGMVSLLEYKDTRWVAAQHLLALEGTNGLGLVIESLPGDKTYEEEEEGLFDLVDFFCEQNVADLKADKEEVEQAILDAVQNASWAGKLTAAHCLGFHGSLSAIRLLQRIAASQRRIPGWKPADTTIAQVAREAIVKIHSR